MNEIERKLLIVREILEQNNLAALHLRGVDWFSWITGGGTSVVIMTAEVGIAEVLITAKEAWILTNHIERRRLIEEELSKEFSVTDFSWQDSNACPDFVYEKVGKGTVASDRPVKNEVEIPHVLQILKMKMQPEEIARYQELGRKAAGAMTEAMAQAQPDWTENQLAGAGAKALWSRGIEPTLILVAGSERGNKYRHPISKAANLNESAMMVFCARAGGLYANLTRFIYFRDLKDDEKSLFQALDQIESAAFAATKSGHSLASIYSALESAYSKSGWSDEINNHHQGGPTGYLSREFVAAPKRADAVKSLPSELIVEDSMAFAWNPSLPGAKVEDTVLLKDSRLEILTFDPHWPSKTVDGLMRPDIWIKK